MFEPNLRKCFHFIGSGWQDTMFYGACFHACLQSKILGLACWKSWRLRCSIWTSSLKTKHVILWYLIVALHWRCLWSNHTSYTLELLPQEMVKNLSPRRYQAFIKVIRANVKVFHWSCSQSIGKSCGWWGDLICDYILRFWLDSLG